MKNRWLLGLCCGVPLGLIAGYLLAVSLRFSSTQPAGKSDQVVGNIDIQNLVATVGDGKWTVVPIPNDQVKEWHSNPSTPPPETRLSTTTRCYVAKCELPAINVDQEQDFFNKVRNRLRSAVEAHAIPQSGGSVAAVPLSMEKDKGKYRYYCTVIHFHTTAEASKQWRGGLRGSATIWLTSDGQTAALYVSLTEVTQGDG